MSRALRALSSCYVERRTKLAQGGALDSAGKRAAFALFYGPLHFFVTREIVRAIQGAARVTQILDLGCGTGAAGAAWAMECAPGRIDGIDRHPWAVTETNWTYRTLGLSGHAAQGTIDRVAIRGRRRQGILAAYAVNELSAASRDALLSRLLEAHTGGSPILIIEPIARRLAPWWRTWEETSVKQHGRTDEWRFTVELPQRQRQLARAAGLQPRELTARSIWLD